MGEVIREKELDLLLQDPQMRSLYEMGRCFMVSGLVRHLMDEEKAHDVLASHTRLMSMQAQRVLARRYADQQDMQEANHA
jgi:hypothetical protein